MVDVIDRFQRIELTYIITSSALDFDLTFKNFRSIHSQKVVGLRKWMKISAHLTTLTFCLISSELSIDALHEERAVAWRT